MIQLKNVQNRKYLVTQIKKCKIGFQFLQVKCLAQIQADMDNLNSKQEEE